MKNSRKSKIIIKMTNDQRRRQAMALQGVDSAIFGKRPPVSVEIGKKLKEKHGKAKHKHKAWDH